MFNYLKNKRSSNYDRDNFDAFLKKVSFSYDVPSIHVGGTNGKGQTCSYIASIYKEAGYKVGLYTSPYTLEPTETIQINGESISKETFEKYINEYKKLFDKYNLTEFEIETFIAFKYFQDQKCDIGVIECGMGGEIDATNIFDSILSIITSISLEHTSVLGRTLGEIAEHKAGIIKENTSVLIDEFDEVALNVFAERSRELDAKIEILGKAHNVILKDDGYHFDYDNLVDLHINKKSLASLKDATFAIEAILLLRDRFNVESKDIYGGLITSILSARMEVLGKRSNIIIDGAHNPEAINALIKDVELISQNRNIHIVFASFKDKNISLMLPTLAILSSDITLTEFDHERCRQEEDYFLYLDEYKFNSDFKGVITSLISEYPDDVILITGSLAFAGIVSELFKKGEFKYE